MDDTAPDGRPDPTSASLTDSDIESMLAGRATPPGYDDVADALGALRGLAATQPPVKVGPALAEFVSQPAADAPAGLDAVLEPTAVAVSPQPQRRRQMSSGFAGTLTAKLAITGGVLVAGLTGAHAADLVDVPFLPDRDNEIEIVLADDGGGATGVAGSDASAASAANEPEAEGAAAREAERSGAEDELRMEFADGGLRIELGDIALSIQVDMNDGEATVDIEIEGVSPACEAAFEALEDITDPAAFDTAAKDIEAACRDELADLDIDPRTFSFDFGELFDGAELAPFLGEDFDPSQLEEFFEDFDPAELAPFLGEDFDPSQLEEFFGDLHNGSGFGLFSDQFDFDDLAELEEFFENFDPSQLGDLLEGFDPDAFLSPEQQEELDRFFDEFHAEGFGALGDQFGFFLDGDFDPPDLERFFDNFDVEGFGDLGDMDQLLEELFGDLGDPGGPSGVEPPSDAEEIDA